MNYLLGSGPEEVDNLCFHTYGELFPSGNLDLGPRAGFRPKGWDLGLETEEEEKKKKIPHVCESVGHRPLWSRCPAPSTTIMTFLSRAWVPLTT